MAAEDAIALAEALVAADRRALARVITLVEADDQVGRDVLKAVYPRTGRAKIIGVTGPPGAGKSTLIGAMSRQLRERGEDVAVLSIDPSSPFSKGALLGDRIRLSEHFLDPGVFIRSMANRGALGGVAEAALQTALLMDAAGFDWVLLETVGVGQAEIDVVDHADTVVLVLMPGGGDSVQALKAGVMEIPDIFVVNKSDHPMTDTLVRELKNMLALSAHTATSSAQVVQTQAVDGAGVEELLAAIASQRDQLEAAGDLDARRRRNLQNEVMELATSSLRRELDREISNDPSAQDLIDQVAERKLDPGSAARELLRRRSGT